MNDGVGAVGGVDDEKVTAGGSDRPEAGSPPGSGRAAEADENGAASGCGGLHRSGGLHDEGGSIGPQGGDWGSGLRTGGNSDSGGPDDEVAGRVASGGGTGWRDGDCGPAEPDENGSAGRSRGANGRSALRPKPHARQNGPDTGAPQAGQGAPPFASRGSSPRCLPVRRDASAGPPPMRVPQTSQKSSPAESWPSGHAAIAHPPL